MFTQNETFNRTSMESKREFVSATATVICPSFNRTSMESKRSKA